MKSTWKRLELALKSHVPGAVAALQPGASEKTVEKLEAKLGGPLPRDLKASLLIHNGQRPPYMSEVLFDNEYLLPCDQISSTWKLRNEVADDLRRNEPQPGTTSRWWSAIYIPVTESDGNGFCVHRDTGAIFYHHHDGDMDGPLFASWEALLVDLAEAIERGEFQVEHGSLWLAK